ncbi:relaxase/mobilization nuclease domain-containing protein, partial [Thalassospira sp. UBA1131]
MIATRIGKKSGVPDNYTRLGQYIAAAEEKGEKLHQFWIRNCDAGTNIEDLDLALLEIEAVRRQKPDIADKTYHLVVSFRSGEQDKLTKEDLMAIEAEYAKALGY